MQISKGGDAFDASQLLSITKNCRRWSGIQSLPPAIRDTLEALDALSAKLSPKNMDMTRCPGLLASIKNSCASLKSEFSKAQITFECPSCPLRTRA